MEVPRRHFDSIFFKSAAEPGESGAEA